MSEREGNIHILTDTFSFSTSDVFQAARDFDQPRRRSKWLILSGGIALVFLIVACPVIIVQVMMPEYADWVWRDFIVLWREKSSAYWKVAALILIIAVGQPLWVRYNISRAVRLNAQQYRDVSVRFEDNGIDFTWPKAALHNEWAFYDAVIESRQFFLLVYGSLYVAIPKRAVSDVPGLANLLRRHIANYEKRS